MRVIKSNPSSRGNSLENLLNLVSICFISSNSAILEGFVEQLPLMPLSSFSNKFLKGYKTALNTENPSYYAHFNFIKQLTSSLREAINHKVDFHIQL